MRWRKANRNKRRALARQHKPVLFSPGWREWLDKILPDLVFKQNYINEHSIFNRLMQPRQYSTYETIRLPTLRRSGSYRTVEGAPIFPTSPNRLEIIWRNVWLGQGCKCAECGDSVELSETVKRTLSFTIICRTCMAKHPPLVMIVDDDIDFSEPARPQPTKEFIYGDMWVAYRRLP